MVVPPPAGCLTHSGARCQKFGKIRVSPCLCRRYKALSARTPSQGLLLCHSPFCRGTAESCLPFLIDHLKDYIFLKPTWQAHRQNKQPPCPCLSELPRECPWMQVHNSAQGTHSLTNASCLSRIGDTGKKPGSFDSVQQKLPLRAGHGTFEEL